MWLCDCGWDIISVHSYVSSCRFLTLLSPTLKAHANPCTLFQHHKDTYGERHRTWDIGHINPNMGWKANPNPNTDPSINYNFVTLTLALTLTLTQNLVNI